MELLIVIGILAILATTVALVLNPAELLRQARDSQRLSDLRTINSAIGLWFASASSTTMTSTTTCTVGTSLFSGDTGSCVTNAITAVDGTGWVGSINFNNIPGGSPLSRLPLDPSQTTTYYYIFKNDGTYYELNTNLESVKYSSGGPADAESNTKDGGDNANIIEVGNDPVLDLI